MSGGALGNEGHFNHHIRKLEDYPVSALLISADDHRILGVNDLFLLTVGTEKPPTHLEELSNIIDWEAPLSELFYKPFTKRLYSVNVQRPQGIHFRAGCFIVPVTEALGIILLVPSVHSLIDPPYLDRGFLIEDKSSVEGKVTVDRLKSRLLFLQQILDAIPSVMIFVDNRGIIRNCNQAFAELFEKMPDEVEGSRYQSLLPAKFEASLLQNIDLLMTNPGMFNEEYQVSFLGYQRTFLITLATMFDAENRIRGVIGIGADITDYKCLESALTASEERLQLAYEATHDGFWDWNAVTGEFYLSSHLIELLRLDKNAPYDHFLNLWNHFHPDHEVEKNVEMALFKGESDLNEFEHEIQYLCGDQQYRWIKSRGIVVRAEDGSIKRIVASVTDIDQHKRATTEVEYLANHDALTRLPNRNLLMDRIHQELALAKREKTLCAIVFADLDLFKKINDSLGHDVGDELLIEVAERFSESVREFDTVSRIGGDEFVILLCRIKELTEVVTIVERMQEEIERPFILVGKPYHISISAGIAIYPNDGDNAQLLMKRADEAMYMGKKAGRNQSVFWEERSSYADNNVVSTH